MKKKTLLTSLLTIVMCLALIAGSTYALFTSEDEINIAVTSGQVQVTATVTNLVTYSMGEETETNGTFANGGTAVFAPVNGVKTLTLDRVTPGDKVTFTIKLTNASTVDVQYRLIWNITGELSKALVINATDLDWTKWATTDATTKEIGVTVELPAEFETQGLTDAAISFTVEAVQANAIVKDVATADQLWAALEMGVENITLVEDITVTNGMTIKEGQVAKINLNGHKLYNSLEDQTLGTRNVFVNKGTLTLVGPGTVTAAATYTLNNEGTLTVIDATVNGGGIYNAGKLTVENTTIQNSMSGRHAIYHNGSAATIIDSTIENTSGNGVIMSGSNNVTITNTSITQKGKAYFLEGKGISLNGGTFTGYVNENGTVDPIRPGAGVTVYGGTFNFNPTNFVADYFQAVESNGTWSVIPAEGVEVVKNAGELTQTLTDAAAAGAGDSTVYLMGNIDLSNTDWTPIKVDGYHGAGVITIEGNGATITGIDAPLFAGGFAGKSGIIIRNLTIADSNIVSTSGLGGGAFIDTADSMQVVTLENCHLINSTVTGERVGGLLGWCSGYAKLNDGPVKTNVTIKNCSVTGCEIIGAGSAAGIAGHPGASDYTYTTIENCSVKDTTVHSNDEGSWRVGAIVGTANNGHVVITNCTVEDVAISQINKTAPAGQTNLFGRFVPSGTGTLVIDGVNYATSNADLSAAVAAGATNLYLMDGTYNVPADAGLTIVGNGADTVIDLDGAIGNINISNATVTGATSVNIKAGTTAVFTNVVFDAKVGGASSGQYGSVYGDITFKGCTFERFLHFDSTHGANILIEDCTFGVLGSLKVGAGANSIEVKNCTFEVTTATSIWGEKGVVIYCPATFTNCEFNNRAVLAGSNGLALTFHSCTMNDGTPVYYVDNTDGIIRGGNVPNVTID